MPSGSLGIRGSLTPREAVKGIDLFGAIFGCHMHHLVVRYAHTPVIIESPVESDHVTWLDNRSLLVH